MAYPPPYGFPGMAPPPYPTGQAPVPNAPPAGQAMPNVTNHPPVVNPTIPHASSLPFPLLPGQLISFKGMIPHNCSVFSLNLAFGPREMDDIAFHFNPRFDNTVVLNSRLSGSWGPEERPDLYFPFTRGQGFEVFFLMTVDSVKVAVNGHHYCEFKVRSPTQNVSHLRIQGDIVLHSVNYTTPGGPPPPIFPPPAGGAMPFPQPPWQPGQYPPPIPPPTQAALRLPYQMELPSGLHSNKTLHVRGVMKTTSTGQFHINLMFHKQANRDIAFHFNPRLKDGCVVRNTMVGYKWGREERSQPHFPFSPGQPFHVNITVGTNNYMMSVNGSHYGTYDHRLRNLSHIKYLAIEGDITLNSVHFE